MPTVHPDHYVAFAQLPDHGIPSYSRVHILRMMRRGELPAAHQAQPEPGRLAPLGPGAVAGLAPRRAGDRAEDERCGLSENKPARWCSHRADLHNGGNLRVAARVVCIRRRGREVNTNDAHCRQSAAVRYVANRQH